MAHFERGCASCDEHGREWREDSRKKSSQASPLNQFGAESTEESHKHSAISHELSTDPRWDGRGGDRGGEFSAARGRDSHSHSRSRSRSPRRLHRASSSSDRSHAPRHHHDSENTSQPSATLIVRGLTPNVSDAMIHHALASFRPVSTRVMFHKVTGEHRGFAFANFDSTEAATAALNAFTSQPLLLDGQVVVFAYADSNRVNPHAPSHGHGHRDNYPPPRLDWMCDQCDSTNFARRTECFKCHASKSPFAMEMPPRNDSHHHRQASSSHYGGGGQRDHEDHSGRFPYHNRPQSSSERYGRRDHFDGERDEPPSNVLAVRMIPLNVDEEDKLTDGRDLVLQLHTAFAQYDGICDIRLVRDRVTNQSRGFAFVEFEDVESATRAKDRNESLVIRGEPVRIGFARETFQSRPSSHRGGPSSGGFDAVPANPMAAAALERAQWALANNYGAVAVQQAETPSTAPGGLGDLDALLGSAAAAARPYIEEPKKPWPLPFESAGGMYRFMSECGFFYDADSMFYYDPQSKLYYNSFMGVYYRCRNGSDGKQAVFEPYTPPLPRDDAKFSVGSGTSGHPTLSTSSDPKPVAMNLTKKKTPLITFSLKPSMSAGGTGNISSAFEVPVAVNAPSTTTASVVGSGVSVAAAASASVRKKSANDIAKWSHRQKAVTADQAPADVAATKPQSALASATAAHATSAASLAAAVDVSLEAPICLLCRRKFASMEQLRKHETLSKLHAENLAKAKQDKAIVGAQIRVRDEEERDQQTSNNKRHRGSGEASATAASSATAAAPPAAKSSQEAAMSALESGIGGKMLKMMGWKKGEGLGKHGTGITAPVEATGNVGNDTTGLGAKTAPAVDLSDIASYKERLQKMARARYDGADVYDRNTL